MDWKNVLERAAWTFVEGFLIALPATLSLEMDKAAWVAVLASAAMAGLSAVKTMLLEVIRNRE